MIYTVAGVICILYSLFSKMTSCYFSATLSVWGYLRPAGDLGPSRKWGEEFLGCRGCEKASLGS